MDKTKAEELYYPKDKDDLIDRLSTQLATANDKVRELEERCQSLSAHAILDEKRIEDLETWAREIIKEGKLPIKEKEYEDRYGYCEIKYCIRCEKVFGRFKRMSTRDWGKKKYCCHPCATNKKT